MLDLQGLQHDDDDVETDYLMRSGFDRETPTTMGDIYPDGVGVDRLTAGQISTAFADAKLTPEPSSLALLAGGLGFAFIRRRRVSK